MVKARPIEKVREAEGQSSLGNDSAHTGSCDELCPPVVGHVRHERIPLVGDVDEMPTGLELQQGTAQLAGPLTQTNVRPSQSYELLETALLL